jgi:ubiquinone/menaquinone biosynthesis C-methylase UbiE
MKRGFLQDKVVHHFEESSDIYSSREGVFDNTDIEVINFFKDAKIKPRKILEVGGGSGFLLDQLAKEAEGVQLINCEISYRVYNRQINPEINLIGGNAIHLPFADNTFEYIISKNLFHHLVGRSRKSSKNFSKMAALEMNRVLKDVGYLMIIEEYHDSNFFAALIFYISLLFSIGNITWKYFDIRPKVIVSFLTQIEIRGLFNQKNSNQDQIVFEKFFPFNYKKLFMRLFPFIFKMGYMVHFRKVEKSSDISK